MIKRIKHRTFSFSFEFVLAQRNRGSSYFLMISVHLNPKWAQLMLRWVMRNSFFLIGIEGTDSVHCTVFGLEKTERWRAECSLLETINQKGKWERRQLRSKYNKQHQSLWDCPGSPNMFTDSHWNILECLLSMSLAKYWKMFTSSWFSKWQSPSLSHTCI